MTRIERRRKPAPLNRFLGIVRLAIIGTIIAAAVIAVVRFASQSDRFLNGIYVNGVSLGGYTREEGYKTVLELADERLNKNAIELRYGDKVWTLTPSMLGAKMDVESQLALAWNFGHTGNFFQRKSQRDYLNGRTQEFNSQLTYDDALLDRFIADIKSEIDLAPKDATVIVEADERLRITQSSSGVELSAEAVKEALSKVIVEGSAPVIELVAQVVEPRVTSEALKEATQLIATCVTSAKSSTRNRITNIRRSLSRFNGFVVLPGETVSFNRVVGKRTIENGFKEAPEFAGTSVQMGIGGGVCQASTTLYNALLRAGMTVEMRYQHTMTVSYIPPSLDATVTDRGKDLVFTNNRDTAIYIYTKVDDARVEVKIYGKPTQHRIELESEIIQDDIQPTSVRKKKDTTGKHATYTDEMVLDTKAKLGLRSRAFICYYDRTTGELVERDELHADYYAPSPAVYWVGVTPREQESPLP